MALTTRQDILAEIVYRMGLVTAIATATGRRDTDNQPYDPDDCPAVNVSFGPDTVDENISQDDHHLTIKLELFTSSRSGDDTAEDLFAALADVIIANSTWGGHADGSSSPSPDTSDIYQVGDIISTGTLNFIVHYTTDKGKI